MIDLFEATQDNDLERVKTHVNPSSINQTDAHGASLLHHAVLSDAMEVFMFLIENGIHLNLQNKYNETPLMIASHMGKLTMMKWLIKYGANINVKDTLGNTSLHRACKKGNLDVIRLLLERGAHTHIKNEKGEIPLHMAIQSHDLHVVAFMIEHSPFEHGLKDDRGNGLLHHAVRTNKIEIMHYLLKKGVFIHHKNNVNETALFEAARTSHTEILHVLIQAGATLNLKNTFNETVYDVSHQAGRMENHALLETVAHSSNYLNYVSHYPLHLACIAEDEEEIKRLLVFNGVDKMDSFGFTPTQILKKLDKLKWLKK